MAATSKSPRDVLRVGHLIGSLALPKYAHKYSPKTYTQPQLFACLVLKSFLKTDYRGVVARLADCPSLVETLGLASVPHYTTLQKRPGRNSVLDAQATPRTLCSRPHLLESMP